MRDGISARTAEVNVPGLAGFLLAETAATLSRRKPKDWNRHGAGDAGGHGGCNFLGKGALQRERSSHSKPPSSTFRPTSRNWTPKDPGQTSPKFTWTIPNPIPKCRLPTLSSPSRSPARAYGTSPNGVSRYPDGTLAVAGPHVVADFRRRAIRRYSCDRANFSDLPDLRTSLSIERPKTISMTVARKG